MRPLLSHVDLRVRDRAAAAEFYDAFLNLLGAVKSVGEEFTSYSIPDTETGADDPDADWFGFCEDPAMTPGSGRVCFRAPTRGTIDAIATILPAIGARNIEMPHEAYGAGYYACFFEDPDGNKLELVVIG
ncbi:glyoxalase [Vulcanimicrobium alpinum]|uniref:Glyoxalase n=1 Tax=Vulcanimicrobium alpinum TaxID=3016050 RepID=A0AAN2CAU5_UNVUL|nr:VOC family protein [Vulcanimicrobium alpinum]BDE08040.1 glyoxalase [Vulcanimicrobium alpinum]